VTCCVNVAETIDLVICGATLVGVANLALAICDVAGRSASNPFPPFLVALGMGLVVLGQVWQLRKQGNPPSR